MIYAFNSHVAMAVEGLSLAGALTRKVLLSHHFPPLIALPLLGQVEADILIQAARSIQTA